MATRLAVAMATVVGLLGVVAQSASAGVGFGVTPTFPSTATVGASGMPASLQIVNSATPPDASNPVTLSTITLVPACGTSLSSGAGDCPTAQADPGVLAVSATATGEAGTACAGKTFTLTVVDAATGKVSFTPSSTVTLGPPGSPGGGDTCRIDFTFSVVKAPTKDSQPAAPGLQTSQLAFATGSNTTTAVSGAGSGSSSVTVTRANPTIVTSASPPTVVGTQIFDSANLAGGAGPGGPTGTITFTLFGPNNSSCAGGPISTLVVPVAGNGPYSSNSVATVAVGTYRWIASYSGDVNNNTAGPTACTDPLEAVVATPATPQLTTTASTSNLGGPIHDTATLTGAFNPTGNITFSLYGPNNAMCTGTPIFTSTVPISGNGAMSPNFTPSAAGTYRWIAAYFGDANNASAAPTPCTDPAETVTVRRLIVPADFDGNGTTDISVFRDGAWYVRGQAGAVFGQAGDIAVPGDYDGDGRTDIAVFRDGSWYIRGQAGAVFGQAGDIPVPGDYDGDGKTDIAVFRAGAWYIRGQAGAVFGQAGDIPVPGDYDGDGKTDIAVFRAGAWYIRGQAGAVFGQAGDIPVPGDYNGDGRTDIAVFRAGAWYIQGQAGAVFGQAGDIPVPGDYNGDGRTDIAVFRNGGWYIQGQAGAVWGTSGDVPLPLPNAIKRFIP